MELGRIDFAKTLLDACLEKALRYEREHIGPPSLASAKVYAILGEPDSALAALRRAVERGWRAGWQYAYEHDLAFEELRETQEFHAIFAELRADIDRQRRALQGSGRSPDLLRTLPAQLQQTD